MWTVTLSKKSVKQIKALPDAVKTQAFTLLKEIECSGPVRGEWPNYGKLSGDKHHCHIKKGNPTYVMVWQKVTRNTVEVIYVGTHEKAPY